MKAVVELGQEAGGRGVVADLDEEDGSRLPKLLAGIAQGKSVDDALAWLRAKATVTPEQEQELRDKAAAQQQAAAPAADTEQLAQAMQSAPDIDALYTVASRLDAITDEAQRLRLNDIFDARVAELEQA